MSCLRTGRIRRGPPDFSGVDPQQNVHAVAKRRLLKLKRLVGNLEVLAFERGVDRVVTILHRQRHELAVPGMSAVLGPAEHPAELGPLVVLRILHECRDRIVNADEPLSARDEVEQRRPQLRVVEQHPERVVEADGVEPRDVRRPEHLGVAREDRFIGTRQLTHLLDGVVGRRDGGGGASSNRLAIAHRQTGHEQTARLPGRGRCFARKRGVDPLLLIGLELLPIRGGAEEHECETG
jgi:hypothetical protein